MARIWIPSLAVLLGLSGISVAADALVTTDQERLEGFAEAVAEGAGEERADAALAHADVMSVPVRLWIDGNRQVIGAETGDELATNLREAFEQVPQGELLQESIQLAERRATVTTRVGGDGAEQTVVYTLVKPDERWLIRRVRVL